jgi:hypothetical protein
VNAFDYKTSASLKEETGGKKKKSKPKFRPFRNLRRGKRVILAKKNITKSFIDTNLQNEMTFL